MSKRRGSDFDGRQSFEPKPLYAPDTGGLRRHRSSSTSAYAYAGRFDAADDQDWPGLHRYRKRKGFSR
ncbi:hypothetical protein GLA29479_395 [Lysobacter antibioticus]|nr:hypothetical protein GLA29479_395 [Lysobacter antibioticus]